MAGAVQVEENLLEQLVIICILDNKMLKYLPFKVSYLCDCSVSEIVTFQICDLEKAGQCHGYNCQLLAYISLNISNFLP